MIARLAGTLVEKRPGRAVIDVGGVGYEVTIPLSTYYDLGDPGGRVELHVHTHVREESLALFGFRSRREKDLFVRLISIGGIGPKTACAILSGLTIGELLESVRLKDAGRLASIPGIGRKTADRILLELGDRLEALEEEEIPAADSTGGASLRQDLVSALVNLGYNPRVAADAAGRALGKRPPGPPPALQILLRESLRLLTR